MSKVSMKKLRSLGIALLVSITCAVPVLAQEESESETDTEPTPMETKPAAANSLEKGDDLQLLHDVEYGRIGNRVLHAEIASPSVHPTKPMPAVLFFHPGGFVEGSHKKFPTFLAKHGFFVASIEYRFSNEAPWPAQIQDGQLSVRWLRANAKKYGIDPDKIGVFGASAGGTLAQWVGTVRDSDGIAKSGGYPDVSDSVKAVATFFGASDYVLAHKLKKGPKKDANAVQLLQGKTYDEDPALWKKASPLSFVRAGDPPFFIAHGDKDGVCNIQHSEELTTALKKADVPVTFVVVHGAGHMWRVPKDGPPPEPSIADVRHQLTQFFNQNLKNN